MKQISIILIIISVLLISSYFLFLYHANKSQSNKLNEAFVKLIGNKMDLNESITIEYINQSNKYPNLWRFYVMNHTEDVILFQNYGFGIRIFCFDEVNSDWIQIEMQPQWTAVERTLEAKLETIDISNASTFNSNNISTNCSLIRIFIIGESKRTGQQFGGYADIELKPK